MKKILCLLACLFCLGSLSAEIKDLTFQKLVPLFPDRDNLKEVSKQYNLTLEKYENDEFEFSCDSLENNHFKIVSISYDYSDSISTWLQVNTCKYDAYSLLEGFFKIEKNRLLYVDHEPKFFGPQDYFEFSFYDNNLKIYSSLYIPHNDADLEDSVTIFLSYDLDSEEEDLR